MKTIVIVNKSEGNVRIVDYDEKLIEKFGGVDGFVHGSYYEGGLGYGDKADIEIVVTDTGNRSKKLEIWDGRSTTPEERAEHGAKEMLRTMNDFGFDKHLFVQEILHEHPTVLQTWMSTAVSAMKALAKQRGTWDDRKKATVNYCCKMEDLGLFEPENLYFPCI